MIIHKLIAHHLGHRDDAEFYVLQAVDALMWLERRGVEAGPKTRVLDLGCGHGIFGLQLLRRGCAVTWADEEDFLLPEIPRERFRPFRIGVDAADSLGEYDLVIVSNVLEHLPRPMEFLREAHRLLGPGGFLFLSWTNWLSPWGGHEFSPFHYLGPRLGPRAYDWLTGRKRLHTPFENLFPTTIGRTLRFIRGLSDVEIVALAPRYYPELAWITRIPVAREFLTWNCSVLLRRRRMERV